MFQTEADTKFPLGEIIFPAIPPDFEEESDDEYLSLRDYIMFCLPQHQRGEWGGKWGTRGTRFYNERPNRAFEYRRQPEREAFVEEKIKKWRLLETPTDSAPIPPVQSTTENAHSRQ